MSVRILDNAPLYYDRIDRALCAGNDAEGESILPYLDEHQAHIVIDAIYRRFPDMPITGTKSPLDKHFTTLGV